jgi:hypothetical protein
MKKNIFYNCWALTLLIGISSCQDYNNLMDASLDNTVSSTRATSDDDFTEGVAAPYSDAIYAMDYVPQEETELEISERDARLRKCYDDFWQGLNTALSSNGIQAWVDSKVHYLGRMGLMNLSFEYNIPEIRKCLISGTWASLKASYNELLTQVAADKASGRDGSLNDLNTVLPAASVVQNAYVLKRLDAYNGDKKTFVEKFIDTYVVPNNKYQGTFLSTGYNKELFSMDVAFWVKMLYADDTSKYALVKYSFDKCYHALLFYSYDADNSPHYDASTGFNLLLHWGLYLGKEDDLRNSIHVRRIIDRMSKTVMNNGMCDGWGKMMWKWKRSYDEYLIDGSSSVWWCLKMGYRLYNDPFYLYMARKYEDFRRKVQDDDYYEEQADVYPVGINRFDVHLQPLKSDQPCSYITNRITSKTQYNGLSIGRGERDYKVVQDKLILSTGHHPRAPFMFMDLSYTSSKAAHDHRMGIDNYAFNGALLSAFIGRPADGFRISRPFVAPKKISDNFPIFPMPYSEVSPSSDYKTYMGYDARLDYTIDKYSVSQLSKDVAYGEVSYTKFQYDGIGAKRKMLLMNNGILVVYDKITSTSGKGRTDVAGVLYQLWPSVARSGKNWALQSEHRSSLSTENSWYDKWAQTLFYFARTKTNSTITIKTDPLVDSDIRRVFSAQTDLNSGEDAEFISLIIPLKESKSLDTFLSGIAVSKKGTVYTVSIPSPSGKPIVVTIGDTEQSVSYE